MGKGALIEYLQDFRRRLSEFHDGSDAGKAMPFNQRPFFNGRWDGSRIPKNELVKVNLDILVQLISVHFKDDIEFFKSELEFVLSCAYSMNHTSFQSKKDKKDKLEWLNNYKRNLLKDFSRSSDDRLKEEAKVERVIAFVRSCELQKHDELNHKGGLPWQTKHALYYSKKMIKNLKHVDFDHKSEHDNLAKLIDYDFEFESINTTALLSVALLNYLGVHVTYHRARDFYAKECSSLVTSDQNGYSKLFGRLDWDYLLKKM